MSAAEQMPWMAALDAGVHEADCRRYLIGWLCTATCTVQTTDGAA